MKRGVDRILTTHVGRLQRPEDITAAMEAHPRGQPTDAAFAAKLKSAVADVVRQQQEDGVDIFGDGEFGKLSWNAYLNGRLGGHDIVAMKPGETISRLSRDRRTFAEFHREIEKDGYRVHPQIAWAKLEALAEGAALASKELWPR